MTTLNFIAAAFATAVKAFAGVSVSLHFSNALKKERRDWLKTSAGGFLYALFLLFLDWLQKTFFPTPVRMRSPALSVPLTLIPLVLAVLFLTLYVRLAGREKFLICVSSAITTVTAMTAIEYAAAFFLRFLSGEPNFDICTFLTVTSPGIPRRFLPLLTKGIQLAAAICAVRKLASLTKLHRTQIVWLTAFSSLLFVGVFAVILAGYWSTYTEPGAGPGVDATAAIALSVILVCIVALLKICFISTEYQDEKERNRLLNSVNALTEQNYQKLSELQKELSKQNHDFAKHMQMIQELVQENQRDEALRYTSALLEVSTRRVKICRSGNPILDAVINSKIAEASQKQIDLEFQVHFPVLTDIAPVDICIVLGNQLDNAIEACQKIEAPKERKIAIHIDQQMNAAIFQVSNTVAENPFLQNPHLRSTKACSEQLHSLGIQNIRETVEKYQGVLENSYKDGRFISSAMLYFTPQYSAEGE